MTVTGLETQPGRGSTTAPKAAKIAQPTSFVPEIEGLRAIAVGLVVADHVGLVPSGFIGVDIFFVISGFLITRLLVAEAARTTRVSFVGFYRRRARRILPAALFALVGANVLASVIFGGGRAHQTLGDSWWAAGFLANFHFASVNTDYFNAALPPSLVQHFWSLSVEEQFYLVWPVLIAAVVLLVRSRRISWVGAQRVLFSLLAGLVLISFVWALLETRDAAVKAYFDTAARAWELGAGALVALAATQIARLPAWFSHAAMILGLGLIAIAATTVDEHAGFPAPEAALPIVGTCLLIASAVSGRSGFAGAPLRNRAVRYVGLLSYSIYLWHWPVIQSVEGLVPAPGAVRTVLMVVGTFGMSMISFHLVEAPFHHAAGRRPGRSLRVPLAAVVVLALAFSALWQLRPTATIDALRASSSSSSLPATAVRPASSLSAAIEAAVTATSFPTLTPSVADLGGNWKAVDWRCLDVNASNLGTCVYGATAGQHTAALLGDSTAISYLAGMSDAFGQRGWRLQPLTMAQCPAVGLVVDEESGLKGFTDKCNEHRAWVRQYLMQARPDLIVLTTAANSFVRLHDHAKGSAAASELQRVTNTDVAQLKQLPWHPQVVVLAAAPEATQLSACMTAGSKPINCVSPLSAEWKAAVAAESAGALAAGVRYVDTRLWFCSSDQLCPGFVGTTPVRWDSTHLTTAYSKRLAPEFGRLFFNANGGLAG